MQGDLQGPLAGIRVMDVSIMGAGPWTGALLGMLGAEVIKVESPAGDGTRWVMPTQRGMGTNYISMNVNKKGIVLDVKTEQGYRDALDLLATCDVFVHNFRGGVIERLKLDYEIVKSLNPRLVYCAVSGFGETGPLSRAGCADPIMQAFSGFARSNGAPDESAEALRFTGFIDLATAAVATGGILAALLERESSGEGQKVEVSMLESALEIQYTRFAELLGTGLVPVPRGSESPAFAPDGAYQAQDREIFVTVLGEAQWKGFCTALDKEELHADPRFVDNRKRVLNRQALNALIAPVIRARPAFWWLRVMQRNGVPSSMAHHFETYRHHMQVLSNDMIARFNTSKWGEVSVGGLPWHFSDTPCRVQQPPQPGEHTKEVLAELNGAGVKAGEIQVSKALKVIEFAQGIAGPLAGARLAELGAHVVKIENAEGDWLRGAAPEMADNSGDSASFFHLNRGKRSLALGKEPESARLVLERLLREADVFITDRGDDELHLMGLGHLCEDTCVLNPRLVRIHITPFGRHGPIKGYQGSELTVQAMAGYTRYLGVHGLPARRLGADAASAGTGMFALQAVLAAIFARGRSGKGQRVDLSLLNSLLSMKSIQIAAQFDPDVYAGPRVGGANYPPERGWKTADDPIFFSLGGSVGAEGRPGWEEFVKEIGAEHLLHDKRFDHNGRNSTSHGTDVNLLRHVYEKEFSRFSADKLVEIVRKHSGNAARYMRADEAIAHPQTVALGIVREVVVASGVSQRVRNFPVRFSRLKPRIHSNAPRLGEHTAEVTNEAGIARDVVRS